MFGSLVAGHLLVAVPLIFVLPLLLAAYLWGPRGHRPVVVLSTALGLIIMITLTDKHTFKILISGDVLSRS